MATPANPLSLLHRRRYAAVLVISAVLVVPFALALRAS